MVEQKKIYNTAVVLTVHAVLAMEVVLLTRNAQEISHVANRIVAPTLHGVTRTAVKVNFCVYCCY